MYKLLRNILFLFPPERAHYFSMNCLKFLCSIGFGKLLAKCYKPGIKDNLKFEIGNLEFSNPIGLGAGFDKNAKYLRELEVLGFGFVEIGTVTPKPQPGNPKPRLFRLPKDKALINRMGFNNDGVSAIAKRLKKWREKHPDNKSANGQLILGGNIGKNKTTPNEEAWKDYEICFKELHPYVDYFVVNVSSPNTPGLRELQEKESLRKILSHLQSENSKFKIQRPILLKIAPDLTPEQLNDVIELAIEIKLDGIVATNTTISREGLSKESKVKSQKAGNGGLSGKPLAKRSTEIVKYISGKTGGKIPVIASGGIFTAEDAKEKFDAGASLLQVWTGFIYEGPGIVKKISKYLF
ncbi:MAG: quinone-dependent dihydroorotate dehydrogenase [Chitinophagaceae bacterium]|nr:quinone-dependent dihydroorotate dehydrogenase [Chitinophagaceae bacterium]